MLGNTESKRKRKQQRMRWTCCNCISNSMDMLLLLRRFSRVRLFVTPWTQAARWASLPLTISWSLPKFMPIESVMPSNYLILCHSLLLLPSIFPSIRVFSNELALHIRRPKYWSFSFSISPSNEYSGLISFRIDWFDFLAVQGNLKSLLQHHSLKASIFSAQPSLWSNSHIHTWLLEKSYCKLITHTVDLRNGKVYPESVAFTFFSLKLC